MNVLITGGAGFLGRHLAATLARAAVDVTVLDDLSSGNSSLDAPELRHNRIQVVHGGTLDSGVFVPLVRSHEVIVHFASVVGVEETIRRPVDTIRNLEGTTLLATTVTPEHTVIFGSSADVYGLHSQIYQREMREDDRELYEHSGVHRWVYSKVKGLEEILIAGTPARSMNIRFFNCYGPGMDFPNAKRVIPQFVRQVLRREPLQVSGDGQQTRTMCYFQDLVEGIAAAIEFTSRQPESFATTINLGGVETVTVMDLARQVVASARDVGLIDEPLPIHTGANLYSRAFDDSWDRVPSLERARALLGYAPKIPLVEGMRRTLAYYLPGSPGARSSD